MSADKRKLDKRLWEVLRDLQPGPDGRLTPEEKEELNQALLEATFRCSRIATRRQARLVAVPSD